MELKDFIKESLTSIINAIVESQQELTDNSGNTIICPSLSRGEYVDFSSAGKRKISEIKFDVAVVAEDKENSKGGISVFSGIFGAGVSTSEVQGNVTSSRIQFTIPVALPAMDELTKSKGGMKKISY